LSYLRIFARYACDPDVGPELDDDDDSDPAGDGGPTFRMPRTMYLESIMSASFNERFRSTFLVVFGGVVVVTSLSSSIALDIRSLLRIGSGVDSRVLRVARRRIVDEFSISSVNFFFSFICLYLQYFQYFPFIR
jgi:hypothetical protein